MNANADLGSLAPRFAVEVREAIKEHLSALFAPEPTSAWVTDYDALDEKVTLSKLHQLVVNTVHQE